MVAVAANQTETHDTYPRRRDGSRMPVRSPYESWLSRAEAADLMRCSERTLIQWQSEGLLHPGKRAHPTRNGIEITVYDPLELVKLERKRPKVGAPIALLDPGVIAARAFSAFDQGQTLRQIVVACCVTVDKARELREQWLDAGGADITLTKEGKEVFELQLGTFETMAELADRVQQALDRAYAAGVEQGRVGDGQIPIDVDDDSTLAHANDEQIEGAIIRALDAAR